MNYADRRRKVQQQLTEQGIDLLAVAPGPDMFYLLGFHPKPDERPTYLLITPEGEELVVPELNAAQTAAHVPVPMQTYSDNQGPDEALRTVIQTMHLGNARTLMVNGPMRSDFSILLQDHIPSARLRTATPLLSAMRMHKEPGEIEALRVNAAQADTAMEAARAALQEGTTETAIARAVEASFAASGADRTNFAIIGGGPNSAFPHHETGNHPIQSGDAVVMDIGGSVASYNGDLTRMAHLGQPTNEYRRVHEAVEAAVQAALEAARPGTRAGAIDDAARRVITDAGYGEYFTHRVGHGIGLEGHEPPYMTTDNDLILEKGMTFSIEPGIYLPDKFGVRLEEIVVVTDDGVDVFSRLPRDLYLAA